ncbi:MAG: hypothetical protein J0L93_10315 [Deltaproteobacteria bacterium]|nr:hypothetical protein [Deltaproteobacteria bacterium]
MRDNRAISLKRKTRSTKKTLASTSQVSKKNSLRMCKSRLVRLRNQMEDLILLFE